MKALSRSVTTREEIQQGCHPCKTHGWGRGSSQTSVPSNWNVRLPFSIKSNHSWLYDAYSSKILVLFAPQKQVSITSIKIYQQYQQTGRRCMLEQGPMHQRAKQKGARRPSLTLLKCSGKPEVQRNLELPRTRKWHTHNHHAKKFNPRSTNNSPAQHRRVHFPITRTTRTGRVR